MRWLGKGAGPEPVFRVKVTHPDGTATYLGPWPSLSTAKGQRTSRITRFQYQLDNARRRGLPPPPGPVTVTIEQADNWTEVPL